MTRSGLAGWMLRVSTRLVPEDFRDSVLGDLQEEADFGGEGRGTGWMITRMLSITLLLRWERARSRFVGMGSRPPTGRGSKGRTPMIDTLLTDLRYAVRALRKSPGFTIVAALSLALGIGATSTIFSVTNAILLRPPPFEDPERLVHVGELMQNGRVSLVRMGTFRAWTEQNQVFEQMGMYSGGNSNVRRMTLPGGDGPEPVTVQFIGSNMFRVLGVQPIVGRTFLPEDGRNWNVILSYDFWQRRFGADESVLGQPLPGSGAVIVGIMPPDFRIHPRANKVEVWEADDVMNVTNYLPTLRWMTTVARLKPGISIEQAQRELDVIARRHAAAEPASGMLPGRIAHLAPLRQQATAQYANPLYLLLGAVGFVLLIACCNVANLLLARGTARQTEIAMRTALGASRGRVIRQLLTESVLLAVLGGLLGVLLAFGGIAMFIALAPNWYPPTQEIRVDGMVLGFTIGISLLTGILFGLTPALQTSKPNLNQCLKKGAGHSTAAPRHRIRSTLVVTEVALALVLLAGAALMMNSFVRVLRVDPGFNPKNLLTMQFNLMSEDPNGYMTWDTTGVISVTPQVAIFYQRVLERIGALPGVTSADRITGSNPRNFSQRFSIVGRPVPPSGDEPLAIYAEVSPDFFQTMETPLLRGRSFTEQDRQGSPDVAIISEATARAFFPGEDPIGQVLQASLQIYTDPRAAPDRPRQIVGIVGDTRHLRRRNGEPLPIIPVVYVPYRQHLWEYPGNTGGFHLSTELVIRTASDPMRSVAAIREVVADVDRDVELDQIVTMEERLTDATASERFWVRLLGIFAGLSVFLAAVGIYGVISYSVLRRRHEFGLRKALGADNVNVIRLVLKESLVLSLIGVGIGLAAAFALTRLISSQLYGVTATDPLTFSIVSVGLVAIALLASYVPARRAVRTDPMEALRAE